MSKVLVSFRVEKEVVEDLRKGKVNVSEIARHALLAERAKQFEIEFEKRMHEASAVAKKFLNVTKMIRESRESR